MLGQGLRASWRRRGRRKSKRLSRLRGEEGERERKRSGGGRRGCGGEAARATRREWVVVYRERRRCSRPSHPRMDDVALVDVLPYRLKRR